MGSVRQIRLKYSYTNILIMTLLSSKCEHQIVVCFVFCLYLLMCCCGRKPFIDAGNNVVISGARPEE